MSEKLELEVRIHLNPHPDKVSPELFNTMMDGELAAFDAWFVAQQVAKRGSGERLLNVERGAIKQYVMWLATKEPS